MVNVFRCIICGEAYIGDEKPKQCPYCGAHEKYIILAKDWVEPVVGKLNEIDKKNVEKALQLEIDNTQFYFCASKNVKDVEGQAMFKRLGKVEREHADVWCKILEIPLPEIKAAETCPEDYQDELKESHMREERAINFYKKASNEAKNNRVKQVFEAVVEVEEDHLALSEERMR